MTTPEDRLRQILQTGAQDLRPAGDGLRRIQQRLADRRSLRSRLAPAVALAGVVAIAGGAAVTVSLTDSGSQNQPNSPARPPAPGPAPTGCSGGLCEEPKPSPSAAASVTTSASGIPLWPFTTDAQAADWRARPGARRWAGDPVQVTQRLLDDYLKLPGRAMSRLDDDTDAALVEVSGGSQPVAQVRLVRVGRDPAGPWSVTGATADNLSVTRPVDGDVVTSPIAVAGRAADPDTSVRVRLMAGQLLGEAFAMAGRELPWTRSLPWTAEDWSVATLVASTFDGKGDLRGVTLTAVRRSEARPPALPAAGTVFVAIEQGHVVSVDALTGERRRQLSYPPPDATDSSPDRGGDDGVVWVRTRRDGCTSSILRAGLVNGPAGVTVEEKPIRRRLPSLSAGGRSLAWVEQPCGGGPSTLVVRGPDAKFSTTATTTKRVDALDVRDDGTALLSVGGRLIELGPGAATVAAGRGLPVPPSCIGAAPAWDGEVAVAVARCRTGWQLLRYGANGTIGSARFIVDVPAPIIGTAIAEGHLLFSLQDNEIARLVGDRLTTVPDASRWGQPDW